MADAWEVLYGLNPNDPLDTIADQDNDGAVALQEFIEGTLPVPDSDNDGVWDAVDNCVDMFNSDQMNTDSDGLGDACDNDDDNDGVMDEDDFAPLDENIFSMFTVSQLSDNSVQITGCIDLCPSNIVVPEFINGFEVTSIDNSAFLDQSIALVYQIHLRL